MSAKRLATSNLNHDNWDQEDEPEDRGTFRKASEYELKNRVIKKARRKVATGSSGADSTDDGGPKSVFSGFTGFGKLPTATATTSPFSFLSKISGTTADSTSCSDAPKNTKPFSLGSTVKASTATDTKEKSSFENGSITKGNLGKSASYQSKIKKLNEAVSEWIKTHVDQNPICILSPIFKDYEKYLDEIENEEHKSEVSLTKVVDINDKHKPSDTSSAVGSFKFSNTQNASSAIGSTSSAGALFSFGATSTSSPSSTETSVVFPNLSKPAIEVAKKSTFSFEMKSPESKNSATDTQSASVTKGFSFGIKGDDKPSSTAFTFGKPAPSIDDSADNKPAAAFGTGTTTFSFGNIKPPVEAHARSEGDHEADEDQPPKAEFKQVVEEDAVYSKKCKVFVKKDGSYVDRGVGTLYLKPVKGSEKTQLLVRADTNLGNVLVNLILSEGIPTQRMGKNNVMMVCLPTPDAEKATSMLIRVKTAEEADEVLAELEKLKK